MASRKKKVLDDVSIANDVLDFLDAEGRRIIQECVNERSYQHRTHNLADSYGYGVYHYGRLARKGFLTASPEATVPREFEGEEIRGRDEIEAFLESEGEASIWRDSAMAFQLVIAAAMPYAEELERRKYKVISMAYDKLKKLSKDIKAGTVTALTGGKI